MNQPNSNTEKLQKQSKESSAKNSQSSEKLCSQPKIVKVDNTYCYVHFLQEVEEEIQKKAFVVSAGLDTFSKAELFAYLLLEARGYFVSIEPNLSTSKVPEKSDIPSVNNSQSSETLCSQQINDLIERYKEPEQARQFLMGAGIIDENGDLMPPYQNTST
jgi:hypothetical protein